MMNVNKQWTLKTLFGTWAAAPIVADVPVKGLALDSREVQAGEVFLACAGTQVHGLDHAAQAIKRGAVAIVWEPQDTREVNPDDYSVPMIALESLSEKVGLIADRYFSQPSRSMSVVGVTGTDGKTSVGQFLAQVLDQESARCGVIGTLGYGLYGELAPATHTTPDALRVQALIAQMREHKARWLVMEVSSHALEQGRVAGVAFDLAVFTNLTREHLDYHGDMAHYAKSKQRLFDWPGLKHAVINLDDAFGRELRVGMREDINVLGYGIGTPADYPIDAVVAESVVFDRHGFKAQVHTPWGKGVLETNLLGQFNVMNMLAVLAALLLLEESLTDALLRLRHSTTVPGRMEPFHSAGKPLVIVDYAHTPAALSSVLHAAREHCVGTLWCVFGCGGDRDPGKRALMGEAAERIADRVVVTDDNPRNEAPAQIFEQIRQGLKNPDAAYFEHDRALAIAYAIDNAGVDDLVVVAGKGHEQVQIVGPARHPFSDVEQVQRRLYGVQG